MAKHRNGRTGRNEGVITWLGEEIRLERGRLDFEGSLRVDGEVVEGHLHGPTLIVSEQARISGSIDVERLIVYGHVDASAKVSESALIAKGGEFNGELTLVDPVLTLEEGGRFHGQVRMQPRRAATVGKLTASPRRFAAS